MGDIRDNTEFGTPARRVADQAYQAIRGTIIKQAPEYADIMRGYEQASDQIREIEKTLSLIRMRPLTPRSASCNAHCATTSMLHSGAGASWWIIWSMRAPRI